MMSAGSGDTLLFQIISIPFISAVLETMRQVLGEIVLAVCNMIQYEGDAVTSLLSSLINCSF